jgi:hypothetical protein
VFIVVLSFFLIFVVSVGFFFFVLLLLFLPLAGITPLRVTAFLQTVVKVLRMELNFSETL